MLLLLAFRLSTEYDTSSKRRAPAWTDRVVWRRSELVRPITYTRHEMRESDHRPVSALLQLSLLPRETETRAVPVAAVDPCRALVQSVLTCCSPKQPDDYARLP